MHVTEEAVGLKGVLCWPAFCSLLCSVRTMPLLTSPLRWNQVVVRQKGGLGDGSRRGCGFIFHLNKIYVDAPIVLVAFQREMCK